MSRLRFLTAGESHGPALLAVVEGLPAGLAVRAGDIDADLARRQGGYGRGGRMTIERDRVRILSGVRRGLTLGSPVALQIDNLDWANWAEVMDPAEGARPGREVTSPRPGHADLAGGMKYGFRDLRDVLERSSARETAARVAAGALGRVLLARLGVTVAGLVEEIGGVRAAPPPLPLEEARRLAEASPFRCADRGAEALFRERVDRAAAEGDTLGGVFSVTAAGLVPGLGSHVHWDRRLDTRLAAAVMSIPGVKGVEIGLGFEGSRLTGTALQDEILPRPEGDGSPWRYRRATNRAGGLEGGMTNGEDVVVRGAMKPIPTTRRAMRSVDLATGAPAESHHERSDVCAVPAAAVVGEAVTALVLADACLEKFGGDTVEDVLAARGAYLDRLRSY